jgi:hypothetical protein
MNVSIELMFKRVGEAVVGAGTSFVAYGVLGSKEAGVSAFNARYGIQEVSQVAVLSAETAMLYGCLPVLAVEAAKVTGYFLNKSGMLNGLYQYAPPPWTALAIPLGYALYSQSPGDAFLLTVPAILEKAYFEGA